MCENQEQWRVLCERALTEQDPKKLLEIIQEINRLLAEKEHRTVTASDEKRKTTDAA